MVLGVFRPEFGLTEKNRVITAAQYHDEHNPQRAEYDAELLVLKHRNGAQATIRLNWHPQQTVFSFADGTVVTEDGEIDSDSHSWSG